MYDKEINDIVDQFQNFTNSVADEFLALGILVTKDKYGNTQYVHPHSGESITRDHTQKFNLWYTQVYNFIQNLRLRRSIMENIGLTEDQVAEARQIQKDLDRITKEYETKLAKILDKPYCKAVKSLETDELAVAVKLFSGCYRSSLNQEINDRRVDRERD